MIEIVGIGDLHFDKLEKLLPEVGNRFVAKELQKPLDYALKNGIPYVFLYGDIAETARMSYESQILFYSVLFNPEYKDLKQWIILGNHDLDEKGRHSLEVLKGILKWNKTKNIQVIVSTEDTEIEGVPVRFLPFPDNKTSSKRLNVGHFESKGAKRDNGRVIKEGVETDHICVVGHLHTCHRVNKTYYSGTLYQTNFGESLPKSFHHIKINEDLKYKVINVPNDPEFKLFNQKIWSRKDLKSISKKSTHLYKLFIQEGVRLDPDDLAGYDNVVRIKRFSDEKDLKLLITEEWQVSSYEEGEGFKPKEDLDEYLVHRKVKSSLRNRALKIHEKLISKFFEEET